MKLFFNVLLVSVALLFSSLNYAMPRSENLTALTYQGMPIDSLCLFETDQSRETVTLKNCGLKAREGRVLTGKNKQLMSQGFEGYDYDWTIAGSVNTRGYSYYKSYGKVGKSVIVQLINNSGGTGTFTSLSLVKRWGDELHVVHLNGGDRCNGGLNDVQRVGDNLIYRVNLTAFDVLMFGHDNPHGLKAYDDLGSCAICCVARAVYLRHLGSDFSNEKLLHVDLIPNTKREGQSPYEPRYQTCFDDLLRKYGRKNNNKLDDKQLVRFAHQFNMQCVD